MGKSHASQYANFGSLRVLLFVDIEFVEVFLLLCLEELKEVKH